MYLRKILLATLLLAGSPKLLADVFYNDCCSPCYDECCGPCFDYAFWFDPMAVKPCQMDIVFAEIANSDIIDTENIITVVTNRSFDPDWCFGFRVGGGIRPQCSPWSFRADYSYWQNSTRFGFFIPSPEGVQTTIDTVGFHFRSLINQATDIDVKAHLDYDYHLLDVTAGWSCCICNGLEFTPYGGFRGLWYTTDARMDGSALTDEDNFENQKVKIKNDYHAYGVVGGVRFDYRLWNCMNFYGSFGGSIVAGDNDLKLVNLVTLVDNGEIITGLVTRRETRCHYIHSLEGKWGVTYDMCLCGFDTHLGLGYEVTQWSTVLPNTRGNLALGADESFGADLDSNGQGLFIHAITARIGVAF
ncbi:MAG: hypothetical protein K940chlam9_00038 [Chlamydiae bacterium]|nr:hypothetical protein [Chlamydiota bacterium]